MRKCGNVPRHCHGLGLQQFRLQHHLPPQICIIRQIARRILGQCDFLGAPGTPNPFMRCHRARAALYKLPCRFRAMPTVLSVVLSLFGLYIIQLLLDF